MSSSFILFLNWFYVFSWAALIFYLSSIPGLSSGLGVWDLFLRKGAHVFEYFVLTGLLARAVIRSWPRLAILRAIALAGVVSVLYAMSDEFHQSFVPGRGPSIYDVMVDAVGVFAMLVFLRRCFGKEK